MINNKKKRWATWMLCAINIVSFLTAVVCISLVIFVSKYEYKEKAVETGFNLIMKNMAADIHNSLHNGKFEEIVDEYADTNLEFFVIRSYNKKLLLKDVYIGKYNEYVILQNVEGKPWPVSAVFSLKADKVYYGENIDNLYNILLDHVQADEDSQMYYEDWKGAYYNIACRVSPDLAKKDIIYEWYHFVDNVYNAKNWCTVGTVVFSALYLISLAVLVLITGKRKNKIHLYWIDKFAFEIVTIVCLIVEIILGSCFHVIFYQKLPVILAMIIILLMGAIALVYMLSLGRRIKSGKLYKYTLLRVISGPVDKVYDDILGNLSLIIRVVLMLSILTVIEIAAIVLTCDELALILICFAIYKIFEYVFVIYMAYQLMIIDQGITSLTKGKIDEKIDVSKLRGDLKRQGEKVNMIGEGIEEAVNERLKSERMKTELITNVSHDIKTPLTSVINYVDLLKKENLQNDKADEYVEVLDRQSARLKKLIDDLIEASKASTGNLDVNMERCNVKVLLAQVLGEMEQRLGKAKLDIVTSEPEEDVVVMADGRHLWRVFDNIVNNISKYSMSNTRVYISVTVASDEVRISFKNISKEQLNISSEELMERFVRGDNSRNTEGSGLGLSIAKSLTELMNGRFDIDIDGDLFKVVLSFKSSF